MNIEKTMQTVTFLMKNASSDLLIFRRKEDKNILCESTIQIRDGTLKIFQLGFYHTYSIVLEYGMYKKEAILCIIEEMEGHNSPIYEFIHITLLN